MEGGALFGSWVPPMFVFLIVLIILYMYLGSVVYCDVTKQNRVAMSRHRHNVASRHYDGSRRCCYSGVN
jgi:hypothetical protein